MTRLFLVGFMGAGKSTVGRIVADKLAMPFVDLDERIVARTGSSIPDIFDSSGEPEFRRLESAELSAVSGERDAIVACGGGVVLSDENRRLMKQNGVVAYLTVTPEQALARMGGAHSRPLLAGKSGEVATSLLEARRSLYESASDIVLDTVARSPEDVADAVVAALSAMEESSDG